jgi:uncharacterized protein YyaL (SSP411 family)
LTVATEGNDIKSHARLIPVARKKFALKGKATAYVCEKGICELPTKDPMVFAQQLRQVTKLKESVQ